MTPPDPTPAETNNQILVISAQMSHPPPHPVAFPHRDNPRDLGRGGSPQHPAVAILITPGLFLWGTSAAPGSPSPPTKSLCFKNLSLVGAGGLFCPCPVRLTQFPGVPHGPSSILPHPRPHPQDISSGRGLHHPAPKMAGGACQVVRGSLCQQDRGTATKQPP